MYSTQLTIHSCIGRRAARTVCTWLVLTLNAVVAITPAQAQDDETWREAKQLASAASTASKYYGGAKTATDVVNTLLTVLGVMKPGDDNGQLVALQRTIDNGFTGVSWQTREALLAPGVGSIWADLLLVQDAVTRCRKAAPAGSVLSQITWCQSRGEDKDPYYPVPGGTIDQSSLAAVLTAINANGTAALFYNPYNDQQSAGMKFLGYSKKELDPQSGNMTYDWRLGVPALLQLMSYRLQIVAAIYPNFRFDAGRQNEFRIYRNALIDHQNKMSRGVMCGNAVSGSDPMRCADIFTGYSTSADRIPSKGTPVHYAWLRSFSLFWKASTKLNENYYDVQNETDEEVLTTIRARLTSKLPLFELKSMIDSLYLYTRAPMSDLTEVSHRISTVASPHLCLDVTGFVTTPIYGRMAQLATCNGSPSQRWTYDRQHGTIKTPATGTTTEQCLGLQDWSTPGSQMRVVKQGWYVGTADCNGFDTQKWTYDPEGRVLMNASGNTVLDVQWSNVNPGTAVWSWPLNFSDAQLWQADQPSRFGCTTCLP